MGTAMLAKNIRIAHLARNDMNAQELTVLDANVGPVFFLLIQLARIIQMRGTWTTFTINGAIVSYKNFHYNAQHSRAQYHDGKGR